ncbi:MAG: HAD-IIIA family hydrolase [Gammaproteobacteria bacterium]|nr:HAD-IIIA family hydrolase [Gammaproteobacteria bacterium]
MKTQLVIFDWDGTLMDSATKIVNCFNHAARDVGLDLPPESAVRNIIGLSLCEACETLFPDTLVSMRTALTRRYRDYFVELDDTPMHLFPGVEAGLRELHRRGKTLAVATGKARRGLSRGLKETGLADLFAVTRCADEARSKPHPQMVRDILAQTTVSPNDTLMVGDTVYDIQMARGAGVKSLAVSYGVHARGQLLEESPISCLDSFEDVIAWICGTT